MKGFYMFFQLVSCFFKTRNDDFRIRVPYPFQWGGPTFDAGEAFAMMMASFVSLIEVCLPRIQISVLFSSFLQI